MPPVRHIAAQCLNPARLNPSHTRRQRQQRRLANPIRADQPDHAARGKHQRNIIQGQHITVAMGHALQPD